MELKIGTLPTTIHTDMRRHDRAVDDPALIKAFLQQPP